MTSSSNDSTMRIDLETTEETVEQEAVVENDSSFGNELPVQYLCNTLKRGGLQKII